MSRSHGGRRSCRYVGTVMHARGGASANAFRYRHGFVAIDLDELPRLEQELRPMGLPLFGWRRRGLLRIDERDWMRSDPGSASLRDDVVAWARGRDAELGPVERVLLVAMPRQLGHVFNPISVFYLTPVGADVPTTAVVEVHNTFGEPHRYLAPVDADARSEHPKRLHVSPFLPMHGTYEMRLPPPGDRFLVRIDLHGAGVPFTATWTGRRCELTPAGLVAHLARFPLGARLVWLRIHLQALRLWALRRATLYRKPPYVPGVGTVVDGARADDPALEAHP